MDTIKQTLKITPRAKILICLSLIFSFSFFYTGPDVVSAASKKAENACKNAIKNTSNAKSKKTLQDNIDACYYGYDDVGDAQNPAKKCRAKYKQEARQGVCIGGSSLAQRAASQPPTIKSCEGDDIKDTKQCKKAYRKCDNKKNKAKCKTKAINDNKKKDSDKKPKKEEAGLGQVGEYTCGTYEDEGKNVHTKFDFGCLGTDFAKTGNGQKNISPILDLVYAVVRFLSIGVGVVIAISIIMSGMQYTMSEGNAEVTQKAKSRIRSAVLGLVIYIFAFSILQFLVPGGVFK
jgi:hypothetical protein